jgi:hypothetical protein
VIDAKSHSLALKHAVQAQKEKQQQLAIKNKTDVEDIKRSSEFSHDLDFA